MKVTFFPEKVAFMHFELFEDLYASSHQKLSETVNCWLSCGCVYNMLMDGHTKGLIKYYCILEYDVKQQLKK